MIDEKYCNDLYNQAQLERYLHREIELEKQINALQKKLSLVKKKVKYYKREVKKSK